MTLGGGRGMAAPPPPAQPPGTVLDGYRLERWLGAGTEGTVYQATERLTRVPVALKLLHEPGRAGEQLAGRTARVFHRLRSTGTVAAYRRAGRINERVYLVFEHLEGVPLAPLLRRRRWSRAWEADAAFLLLAALARKLAAAHRLGIALGDFSHGHNILLLAGYDPVWCDLDAGSLGWPNRNYGFDLELLAEIAADLAAIQPCCPTLGCAADLLRQALGSRATRSRMRRLAEELELLRL